MGFWFVSKKNFNLEKEKFSTCVKENKYANLDILDLSQRLESIIKSPYLSDSLVEDLIWIGSQARIRDNQKITSIVLAFAKRAESLIHNNPTIVVSLEDSEKKIRQLNSLISIAASSIQDIYPQEFPSFTSCLTLKERKQVEDKLDEMELTVQLDDSILEITSSTQVSMLDSFRQAPVFEKIYAQIILLQDAAISDAHNADIAKASLQYLILNDDVIDDSIGLLGLVDDLYALDIGMKNSRPESFFSSLVNRHDEIYPAFSLPSIRSTQSLSLINLENIIKASYTKLSDERLKRLLILPDIGPLHVLIAMSRAICNRINASNNNLLEPTIFNIGDNILLGTLPATSYGKKYEKSIIAKYAGPSEFKNLFWVTTSIQGEKVTVNKSVLEEAKVIGDGQLSQAKLINKFKNYSDKRITSWGALDFSINVKNTPSEKKIFIFSTQKKINEYLKEEVFDSKISDWFGVRYFDKKGLHKDTISQKQIFPEPMFYTTSNKDQALEMLGQRWVDKTYGSEPMLIIVHEAAWLNDIYFLKELRKVDADVLILSKYFDNKKNSLIQNEGFKTLTAKPEALIPIKETIAGERTRLESYLHRSQPVNTEIIKIQNSIVDELIDVIKVTKFDEEHRFKKYKLIGFLRAINQRIVPLSEEEYSLMHKKLIEIIDEFSFLARFNEGYNMLFNYINAHRDEFLLISRIEDVTRALNALPANNKSVVLAPYSQIHQVSENLNYELSNKNIKVVNHNHIDYESNIQNLIIPIFIDKYQFQRLRNYNYAKKHIFLMTERESKLNSKVEKYERQLFSSIYANKPIENLGQKITIEDIDELIEDLNPFNEILQTSLQIVNNKFKSVESANNIPSKIFILENEKILILPEGGSTLTAMLEQQNYSISMNKVISLNIGNNIVISDSISGHDLLEAVMKNSHANLQAFNSVEKNSQEWQVILRNYIQVNSLSIKELRDALSKIGIDRDTATIASWVSSPDTIAPQNRNIVIPKLFELAGSIGSSNSMNCLEAIDSMYKLRAQARDTLKEILQDLEIPIDKTSFEVEIEEMQIKFQIHRIKSIAESEVEFKYLYRLHDLENLSHGELNHG